MTRPDVIVVGGGVMGSAIALELSKAGAKVLLLERGNIASGASGMSAAMLEAQLDSRAPGPFSDLAMASRALFPALASELLSLTGVDIGFEACGILQVASNEQELDVLHHQLEWQKDKGWNVEWWDPTTVRTRVAGLAGPVTGGGFFPEDGQVNASRFTSALAEGARRLGAVVREGTAVTGFLTEGRRVIGVEIGSEWFKAEHVVLAAGPWTRPIGFLLQVFLPIEPVRGQLLIFKTPHRLFPSPVYTSEGYIVPKRDGLTLVGTTNERVGFNMETTEEAVDQLRAFVVKRFPALQDQPFAGAVAGLRPAGPPDQLPIIGPIPPWQGLWVASGHYRNGILLAPITAQIIAALILGRTPPIAPDPFLPSRLREPSLTR